MKNTTKDVYELVFMIPNLDNEEELNALLADDDYANTNIDLKFEIEGEFNEFKKTEILKLLKLTQKHNINPSKIKVWIDFYDRKIFDKEEFAQLTDLNITLNKQGTSTFLFSTETGSGDDSLISPEWKIDAVEETNNNIHKMVGFTKENKLSPLETLIYFYKNVTSKEYNEVDDENANLSRHVFSVVLGDKIVCVGYAQWLELLIKTANMQNLKASGIGVYDKRDEDPNPKYSDTNHQALLIYIEDNKYGLKGYYYLDPTRDSFLKEGNHVSFAYFLVPIADIEEFKIGDISTWDLDIVTAIQNIEKQLYEQKHPNQKVKFIDIKETNVAEIFKKSNLKINFTDIEQRELKKLDRIKKFDHEMINVTKREAEEFIASNYSSTMYISIMNQRTKSVLGVLKENTQKVLKKFETAETDVKNDFKEKLIKVISLFRGFTDNKISKTTEVIIEKMFENITRNAKMEEINILSNLAKDEIIKYNNEPTVNLYSYVENYIKSHLDEIVFNEALKIEEESTSTGINLLTHKLHKFLPKLEENKIIQCLADMSPSYSYQTIENALINVLSKANMDKEEVKEYISYVREMNVQNFHIEYDVNKCQNTLGSYKLFKDDIKLL